MCIYIYIMYICIWGFPGGSDCKESTYNAGNPSSIPGSGRSPGEGNDNPFQYSWLENSTDKGAWQAIVCGVAIAITLHGGIGVEISWLNRRPFSLHNSISGFFFFFYKVFIYLFIHSKKTLTDHKPCARLILQEVYSWEYIKAMLLSRICVLGCYKTIV